VKHDNNFILSGDMWSRIAEAWSVGSGKAASLVEHILMQQAEPSLSASVDVGGGGGDRSASSLMTLHTTFDVAAQWIKVINYVVLGIPSQSLTSRDNTILTSGSSSSSLGSEILVNPIVFNEDEERENEEDSKENKFILKYNLKPSINKMLVKYWRLISEGNYNELFWTNDQFLEDISNLLQVVGNYHGTDDDGNDEKEEEEEDVMSSYLLQHIARRLFVCSFFRPSMDVTYNAVTYAHIFFLISCLCFLKNIPSHYLLKTNHQYLHYGDIYKI
jgi:hypothetical protein